jgi:hypothetical protein
MRQIGTGCLMSLGDTGGRFGAERGHHYGRRSRIPQPGSSPPPHERCNPARTPSIPASCARCAPPAATNASSNSRPQPSAPLAARATRRPAAVCLTATPGQFERWSDVSSCDDSVVTVTREAYAQGPPRRRREALQSRPARQPASASVETARWTRYPQARTSSSPPSLCDLTAVQSSRRRDQARRWIGRRDGL